MKHFILILAIFWLVFPACSQTVNPGQAKQENFIDPKGTTIETRFILPAHFKRTDTPPDSFAGYLRKLPLKPHGSRVKYYNGEVKRNDVYDAVVDLAIGTRDLHQCADAIMRLRGEYFFKQKQYDQIHFNFTNGFRVDYSKWAEGFRIVVKGNKSYWKKSTAPSNTYNDFKNYMNIIFSYAGTLSLAKELDAVDYSSLQIGDVFIQGGSPGHAVIVADLAINTKTGAKIYLLAQSYMPAQEIQVLKNPENKNLSPWYELDVNDKIIETPEWTFKSKDLKRF